MKKGFTMIQLAVVLAIATVLMAILMVAIAPRAFVEFKKIISAER